MKRNQAAYSIVELVTAVCILLILASLAIPSLLKAIGAAHEASAIASLRTIGAAQTAYLNTYGTGFTSLSNLGGASGCTVSTAAASCLIDSTLTSGVKSGYQFQVAPNTGAGTAGSPYVGYEATATRTTATNGVRSFCTDQSGLIHYNIVGNAIGTGAGSCAAISSVLQ